MAERKQTLSLSTDSPVNFSRPSIDVLFESASRVYEDNLIGILLTGANKDGSKGSDIESGIMGFEMAKNNLKQILDSILIEFETMKDEKEIVVEIEENVPKSNVVCDVHNISLVFKHLLSNASKYTLKGKKVIISINSTESVSNNNEGNSGILIKVIDQGIGILENERMSVFKKFVQSSKTNTGTGGIGLGLAICKEIIKAHKGKIWVENNPEGGSTFSFVLPHFQK
jgi:signal transduction histidine kinase